MILFKNPLMKKNHSIMTIVSSQLHQILCPPKVVAAINIIPAEIMFLRLHSSLTFDGLSLCMLFNHMGISIMVWFFFCNWFLWNSIMR